MNAVTNPVEIDTQIAKTYGKVVAAQDSIKNLMMYVRFEIGAGKKANFAECVESFDRRKIVMNAAKIAKCEKMLARATEAHDALELARQAFAEADAQYEGWSRFFVVAGGHIHSSRYCSSCNKNGSNTSFGWLPELSGLTEADAVAKYGSVLCSICFPTAPVAWTTDKTSKAGA